MQTQYETKRLILQVLTPDWCHEVLRFYQENQAIFQPYDPYCPEHYYTAEYQSHILSCEYTAFLEQRGIRFYVFEKSNPSHIVGTISFNNMSHGFLGTATIGYKIESAYQNRGYAFEALQKGIELMFYEVRLHRLTAYIMPNNLPSIRLIQRLYFTYEGLAKEYALIQGTWEDHCQYALINHL